jgi:hypothetical protein
MNRDHRSWMRRFRAPWCLLALTVPMSVGLGTPASAQEAAVSTAPPVPRDVLWVTSTRDGGRGSLRDAIDRANDRDGPDTIRFDSTKGPFGQPRTITLTRPLPELAGELTIDGYIDGALWKTSGVTVSGQDTHRVFNVRSGARVTLASLTVARGHSDRGGGIANRGALVVKGVTLIDNRADADGGGLANLGGRVAVINSTFVNNRAGSAGGGVADDRGGLTVTNCSFSGNAAPQGGALFSSGTLLLRNSILANSATGPDCVAQGGLDPASTHNLIEAGDSCGEPLTTADPRFESLGAYNGPTSTLPLGGGSPAINLGDNASALDEFGERLVWDQRGNGDPRFVAGLTDIGAFETQAFPKLKVNTAADTELRACTGGGTADCPLRGAIALANAMGKATAIHFDPQIFATKGTLAPTRPLPVVAVDLTLDAGTGMMVVRGEFAELRTALGVTLTLRNVTLAPTR